MKKFEDLTNQVFGRLKVIRKANENEKPHKTNSICWLCECICGSKKVNSSGSLKSGRSTSCGCYALEQKKIKWKDKAKPHKTTCVICGDTFSYFCNRKTLLCGNIKCKRKYASNFATKKNRTSLKFNIGNIVHSIKTRSKEKNLTCDIDTKFVLSLLVKQDNKCAITQVPFSLSSNKHKHPWQPSIDRIDPNKGYTKDNIQLVCMIYNFCKHTWTHKDVVEFSKTIIK